MKQSSKDILKKIYASTIKPIPYQRQYLLKMLKSGCKGRTVLFYPEKPISYHAIYKICLASGCRITKRIGAKPDLVIRFADKTKQEDNVIINSLSRKYRVLNLKCVDISKSYVDMIFAQVFGYELDVDPAKHERYVRKSVGNAAHDGIVVTGPSRPEEGYVYQKMINNLFGDYVRDSRVPIIDGKIPIAYYTYKKVSDRFGHPTKAELMNPRDEFNDEEIDKIIKFSSKMGLDVGELDILRDRDSGLIYVIDVNNTAYGTPSTLTKSDRKLALLRLAEEFEKSYFC